LQQITIRRPCDPHVHFRFGLMLALVAPLHRLFHWSLAMPNVPEIRDADGALDYRLQVERAIGTDGDRAPIIVPTIKLTHATTPRMIARFAGDHYVKAAKLYPCKKGAAAGVTTGSHNGIHDVTLLTDVFKAMQSAGVILCIHAEDPDTADPWLREEAYLPQVEWITSHFPGLRVVIEHISTAVMARFVEDAHANVAATITPHHLRWTRADLYDGGARPHRWCCPVLKTVEDRAAVRRAAWYCERVFFGSDSAPHAIEAKEKDGGAAGIFAPAEITMAAEAGRFLGGEAGLTFGPDLAVYRAHFEQFVSLRAPAFYGLAPAEDTIVLERTDWRVPSSYGGHDGLPTVVPFLAGETLWWRVVPDAAG
jgi:dihydroorotase